MPETVDVTIRLPTLHEDQVRAFLLPGRFKAIRCGRRWGKTTFGLTLACDAVLKGRFVGIFAPDYKRLTEIFHDATQILAPVAAQSSKVEGILRLKTGGRIDFWTLEDESAGRSRKYHLVMIDEAAFTKANMLDIWERSIKPTLLDYNGCAVVMSNTNGIDEQNFFWRICNEERHGFVEYHAPTRANPVIPERLLDEEEGAYIERRLKTLDKLKIDNPPMVFRQEYEAEFVDWSGDQFFALPKLLVEGHPLQMPARCDVVFAVIDSATKTGKDNDGTGCVYFAKSRVGGAPLAILDYDYAQIEGALLENWLPGVFKRLEELARQTGARMGSLGVWIEDKSSGMVLLQQARRRGWQARAIESKLTAVGKDERAISISGYVHREMVKLTQTAHDRVSIFKGVSRNHLLAQILGFRVGDKDAATRADDLLDCFTYGVALALGDAGGF